MSPSATARKFGFTQQTVGKHVHNHMGDALAQFNLCAPVLDQINLLNRRCLRILNEADAPNSRWKNPSVALAAVRELRNNHELIARLTGELKSTGPTNEPVTVRIVYVNKSQLVVDGSPGDPPVIEAGPAGS
jgi:hypothetical protein